MSRLPLVFAALLVGLAAAGAVTAEETPAGETFLDRIDIHLVDVEVFVTDKKGAPVTDLTAADFRLFADGERVEITHFSAPQAAPSAAAETLREPFRMAVFVDNFAIQPATRSRAIADLSRFFADSLRARAQVAVISYDGELRVHAPFTSDLETLQAALAAVAQPSSLGVLRLAERETLVREGLRTLARIQQTARDEARGSEASRHVQTFSREIDAYAARLRNDTQSQFQAMIHVANSLASLPGRKALVHVSDGLPMRPGEELYHALDEAWRGVAGIQQSQGQFDRDADISRRSSALDMVEQGSSGVRDRGRLGKADTAGIEEVAIFANGSGVAFYTYKPSGHLGGVPAVVSGEIQALYTPLLESVREQNLSDTLRVLADLTGGAAVIGGDLDGLLAGAQADADAGYSLGFTPVHPADGGYHPLRVEVRGRGVRARHRHGYFDKPVVARLADRTSSALLLGRDDNPLGLTLEAGPAESLGRDLWAVPLILSVPLGGLVFELRDGVRVAELDLFVAARDERGEEAPVRRLGLRIELAPDSETAGRSHPQTLPLKLRAGRQRVAVGVVDPVTRQTSFVSLEIEPGADAAAPAARDGSW